MKITGPATAHPSLRQMHDRQCFLLGITEPWKVEKLWAADEARRNEYEAARRRRR